MATPATAVPRPPSLFAWTRALTFCLLRVRFSVIILLAGLGLLLSDQGLDLVIAYSEDDKARWLALAATGWALSVWGWSRVLLDIRFPEPPGDVRAYNFWRKWTPRALGALAFLVVAAAAVRANRMELLAWMLGPLVLFIAFTILRRRASRALAELLRGSRFDLARDGALWLDVADFDPAGVPPHANLWSALGLGKMGGLDARTWRLPAVLAVTMLLSFILLSALGWAAPIWLGTRTGAMILFFLWAITWLPIGSWMSYAADVRGIPLLSVLLVLAFVSSFWNDNHRIRPRGDLLVDKRPSMNEALQRWAEKNAPTASGPGTPFVVVATAGGGIRAAYWTATVLGALDDAAPRFRHRTFAVSGVSGGSVGATVYRALQSIDRARLPGKTCCHGGATACGQCVLGGEFLGPLVAATLYPDLAQRFFPAPWFPDRGKALEESWEKAFLRATGTDGLGGSLAEPPAPGLHLFLNATHAEAGQRIVASDVRLDSSITAPSKDQLGVLKRDLRLSTAAHNSARFPFVSPAGTWPPDGKIAGRLQDGGLVENYGAATALEVLDRACRMFNCDSGSTEAAGDGRPRIRPVVVIITSDPSLTEDRRPVKQTSPITFSYEVRTTIMTYEHVRDARGAELSAQLADWGTQKGAFFQFRMCADGSTGAPPPLGWALSAAARKRINGYLFPPEHKDAPRPSCFESNATALRELRALLR